MPQGADFGLLRLENEYFRDDYVSPADRHAGRDGEILKRRHDLYLQARVRNPKRWSGRTRNWSRIDVVTLNPERKKAVAKAATGGGNKQELAT
jgi:putative transposase